MSHADLVICAILAAMAAIAAIIRAARGTHGRKTRERGKRMPVKDFVPPKRLEGEWNGEHVSLNAETPWQHTITDDEFATLCDGGTIEFDATSKAGRKFKARVHLGHYTSKSGREYPSLEFVDDDDHFSGTYTGSDAAHKGKNVRFKRVFRGKRLSDADCKKLLAGKEVPVRGLVSKKTGNEYAVYVTLAQNEFDNAHGEHISYFGLSQTGFVDDDR